MFLDFRMENDVWISDSGSLRKEMKNPYAGGCIFAFGTFFLGCFAFFSLLYFGVALSQGEASLFSGFISFFTTSLFLIFLLSMIGYRRAAHIRRGILFDWNRSLLVLSETERSDIEFSLSEFVSYMVLFRSERSDTSQDNSLSRTWKFWDLYLLHEDGSCILLESFSDKKILNERIIFFREKFPLPIWNRTSRTESTGSKTNLPRGETPKHAEPSPWVKTEITDGGTLIRVKEGNTPGKTLILFLVPAIFYGAWGTIASSFFSMSGNGIMLLFFIPFSIFFLGILTIAVVFVMFRKMEIVANSGGIRIRYTTSIPILSQILAKERRIPVQEIRQIRTLRIEKEMQVLCIALKENPQGFERHPLDFLYNVQAVSLSDKKLPGDRELIGIWTIPPWIRSGPGYPDLVYAEGLLQDLLGIQEEKILWDDLS